ncbi:WXG100 family type VII secretion target [Micromonospora sp. NPDC004336]
MTQPDEVVRAQFQDMDDAAQFAEDTRKQLESLAGDILKTLNLPWEGLSGDAFAGERKKFLTAWGNINNALGELSALLTNQISADLRTTDGSQAGLLDGAGSMPTGSPGSGYTYVSAGLTNN